MPRSASTLPNLLSPSGNLDYLYAEVFRVKSIALLGRRGGHMGRLAAVTVSVIAGIVAGAVSGKLIDTWTWPLGIALGVSVVALIVTQLWLSKKDGDGRSSTGPSGTGAITAKSVHLADQLAEVLEGQWTREANKRGLLAPEAIPVKWRKPSLALAGPPTAAAGSHLFTPLPDLPSVAASDLERGGDISGLYAAYGGLGSGRLVIAGSAGSGKTGAAVLLVLDALRRRKRLISAQRLDVPVPLLFTAQEWDPVRQPVQDWLTQRIQEAYPLFTGKAGLREAVTLINDGKIALILDGFDEIAEDLRPTALQALSQQATFRLVVLTRTAEMASAASERGVLEGAAAVELQAINAETAAAYLTRIQGDPPPDRWRQLVNYIRKTPESSLAVALNNPLTLTLVRDTYRKGEDAGELLEFCGVAGGETSVDRPAQEIIDHLLDRFLFTAYMPRPGEKKDPYTYLTAQRAFAKIAAQMNHDGTRDLGLWWLFQSAPGGPRNMLQGLVIAWD